MSENTDTANDYALAKALNERVINIFTMVVDHKNTPDFTDLNQSYVLLIDELKRIYDRQPELKNIRAAICWRVLDNLEQAHEVVPTIEFTNSGSDYGQGHNTSVSSLCIREKIKQPVLSPELETLLKEADDNITNFKTELDKMYVKVSIEEISGRPVVTIGDEKYRLSAMRDGLALTVVSYCLKKHPNEQISIEALKSELTESKLKSPGLNNLRENIRNSHFGGNNLLSPFVEAYPKAILVRSITELTDEQMKAIELAGS